MTTARQEAWLDAAEHSDGPAKVLFTLIALPNDAERGGHVCLSHTVGFRRDGRRGFKCGICKTVVKWVDPEEAPNV